VLAERGGRGSLEAAGAPSWLRGVAELLACYAAGGVVDFSDVGLDLEYQTPLGRRIIAACRAIPRGEVRT
jgi:hypothetical protein